MSTTNQVQQPEAFSRDEFGRKASLDSSASKKRISKLDSTQACVEAVGLPAVQKINCGCFDLSVEDILDLFRFLDEDHSGALEFVEIARLLKTVLQPACTDTELEILWELTDKNEDGTVTVSELRRAFQSAPFKDHLKQLQREAVAKRQLDINMGNQAQNVTREVLMDRLNWRVHRDDSFRTLPLSLVVFCIFTALVVIHLQVWKRQQLQRGIEAWIGGYGQNYPGPYHGEHVGDPTQMWEWLVSSGLTSLLTYCANGTSTGAPHCPFATRSSLVGDIRLRQKRRDGAPQSEWLLHTPQALDHLRRSPGDFRGAASAGAHALWNSGWVDGETNSMDIVLTSWNERVRMFALSEVRVDFDSWGFVIPNIVTRAVIIEPYSDMWALVVDIIYLFLLSYPTYMEVRDLLNSVRMRGCWAGCVEYWGFWNAVDWSSIVMGWTNIAIWIAFCFATQDDAILQLLEERGSEVSLVRNVMSLDTSVLEAAEMKLERIVALFYALQLTMGFNVVSIMLKFFKAFQANPRLQLVTNTLIQASDELFHFLIVFLAIFLGFSVSGHILFGDDLIEFSSFDRSMETSFRILLGDFGWYSDQSISDTGLGSGLPHWMLALWFCFYSTFVTLIVLNMLLAIIMDHYTELVMHVRSAADAPTIWKQTANYIKRARDTKGFIPFFTMLCQLRDKDRPAHTTESVTQESLMEAFDGMKKEQADFIMNWLATWATERARAEGDEEHIARLKEVSSLMRAMSDQMHVVSLNTSLVSSRLQELQVSMGSRLDGLEASVSTTAAKMVELETLMQAKPETGVSAWARSAQFIPPMPQPDGDAFCHGANAAREARGLSEPPGLRKPQSSRGVAEPKLVAHHQPRNKHEVELQPCCSATAWGGKSTIVTTDRRR